VAGILRGGIYWADLNPVIGGRERGLRPVLVLSHDVFNDRSGTVIGVSLTSQPQKAGYPLAVALVSAKTPKASWAKVNQIRVLSTERIGRKISRISDEELALIIDGLNEIIEG